MSTQKSRVLLVEDEEIARKTLKFYLNTIFDEVITACDGEEGINLYKSEPLSFDLVLTDIKMPNINGIEMIDEIVTINPEQRFIIVSAYKNEDDLLKLINLKVLGYFLKPLDVDDMMKMLQKAKDEIFSIKNESVNEEIIKLNKTFRYKRSEKGALFRGDELIKLSNKESMILKILVENINSVISLNEFKKRVWPESEVSDSAFRTLMKRLRDKLIEDDFIISYKGEGYTIERIKE